MEIDKIINERIKELEEDLGADYLFLKLGYKKYESDNGLKIIYIAEGIDHIEFELNTQTFKAFLWNDGPINLPKSINKKELHAINKKIKELRWKE